MILYFLQLQFAGMYYHVVWYKNNFHCFLKPAASNFLTKTTLQMDAVGFTQNVGSPALRIHGMATQRTSLSNW